MLTIILTFEIIALGLILSSFVKTRTRTWYLGVLLLFQFVLALVGYLNQDKPYWRSATDIVSTHSVIAFILFNFMAKKNIRRRNKVESMEPRKEIITRVNRLEKIDFYEKLITKYISFNEVVSIELRTIITTIIGYIGLLRDTKLTSYQEECLHDLEKSSDYLTSFVNNFTTYIKADLRGVEIDNTTAFTFESLFDSLIEGYDVLVESHNLEVILEINPEVPYEIFGDKKHLTMVLSGILDNAIKFTSTGEIVLSVSCRGFCSGKSVIDIAIKDTGIGISKERIPNIFSAMNNRKGNFGFAGRDPGLGLPTAERLTRLFDGGSLHISSVINEGTEVTFTANFKVSRNRKTVKRMDTRILVLGEDSYPDALKGIIERQNISTVDICHDKSSAFSMLVNSAEDGRPPYEIFIVQDSLEFNDMDGFIKSIRDNENIEHLKVMILSNKDTLQTAKVELYDSLLIKPVVIKTLIKSLKKLILSIKNHYGGEVSGLQPVDTNRCNLTILVAEDDYFNRNVLMRIIDKADHICIAVTNGQECLEYYKSLKGDIDLIFMDYQMPVLDGLEATRIIREYEKLGSDTPTTIVGFTASENLKSLCIESGMDDCLVKPVVVTKVHAVLEEVEEKVSKRKAGEI